MDMYEGEGEVVGLGVVLQLIKDLRVKASSGGGGSPPALQACLVSSGLARSHF